MRVCVLTTETLHHAFFARALAEQGHELLCLLEEGAITPPFETAHPFEKEREEFERAVWFDGRGASVADFAPARTFDDINAPKCVRALGDFAPELIVTFGTRRLREDLIALGGNRLVNLHGGDPEHYRGLDTHLWAIWHRDFGGLSTCLHRIAAGLDTGDVVACLPLSLERGMGLHQLRKANTETCVALVALALSQVENCGHLVSRPQRSKGRYYSFMPAALKDLCVKRFARHTESLP